MNFDSITDFILKLNLEREILGNAVGDYVATIGVFVVLAVALKFIQWLILLKLAALAKKTKTDIDDMLITIVKSLKPAFYYIVAFFFAVRTIEFSVIGDKIVNGIFVTIIAYQIVIALQILIDYVIKKKFTDSDGDGVVDNSIVSLMSGMAKFALWAIGLLMVLTNLGVNVTGLVAGLGVGGLAIAFALQGVFADLFASFSIYLDKPFSVGDYIVVGEHRGNVEKIGIKTTRIRAPQGEEIVISNQELTSVRVQNFKKLQKRRISTQFGVTYDTPTEKVKNIPGILQKIVEDEKITQFDRAYFTKFGDSALLFDLVYYVDSDVYTDYLSAQQNMNLKIKEAFEKEGIVMAYPTQTIYLAK